MSDPWTAAVLIAEDEPTIRDTLAYLVQDLGWSVATAESGDAAFARLSGERYGCVISDHRMAEGDGLSLARRWPQILDPGTPMMIQTSEVSPALLADYATLGVTVYEKPLLPEVLKPWITAVLEGRAARG